MTSERLSAALEYLIDLSDGMRNDGDGDGANKVDLVVGALATAVSRAELAAAVARAERAERERDEAVELVGELRASVQWAVNNLGGVYSTHPSPDQQATWGLSAFALVEKRLSFEQSVTTEPRPTLLKLGA